MLKAELATETKKSSCLKKTLSPLWGESFLFNVRNVEQYGSDDYFIGAIKDELTVSVWDFDLFQSNEFMGSVTVPLSQLLKNQTQKFFLRLEGVPSGFIYLEITAQHCGLDIGDGLEVPNDKISASQSTTSPTLQIENESANDTVSEIESLELFRIDKLVERNETLQKLYKNFLEKNSKYDYELIQPLGEGAVGIVYKAVRTCKESGKTAVVALKKVTIDHLQTALEVMYEVDVIKYLDEGPLKSCKYLIHHNDIFLESVNKSAKSTKGHHKRENSVQSMKDLNDEVVICFEMQLFDLGDMQKFLEMKQRQGKKLQIPTLVSYLKQLSQALALMHHPELQSPHHESSSYILTHRDIKPQNIFFSDEYSTLKLGDYSFLLRQEVQPEGGEGFDGDDIFDDNTTITSQKDVYGLKTTKLCGSIPHMAPELYTQMISDSIAEDSTLTPSQISTSMDLRKTDIFSFGVIAYQLVTYDTKIDHSFYTRIMPGGTSIGKLKSERKKQKQLNNDFVEELEFEIYKSIESQHFDLEEPVAISLKEMIMNCLKWNASDRPTSKSCWQQLCSLEEGLKVVNNATQ